MALEHQQTMSVEEYFKLEETDNEHRYEYVDGYVYMMSGGTADHSTISGNIHRVLWGLLRGKPCRVYNSDMKVRVSESRYFHPDITASCDPRDRGTALAIQCPRLVVEVLSPGTEMIDRTQKLRHYCACPTIEEYLLVDTKAPRIEVYRKELGKWVYDIYEANDTIMLTSLEIQIPLAEAYTDIDFANISEHA
jgi:Uma2 family endonuclease